MKNFFIAAVLFFNLVFIFSACGVTHCTDEVALPAPNHKKTVADSLSSPDDNTSPKPQQLTYEQECKIWNKIAPEIMSTPNEIGVYVRHKDENHVEVETDGTVREYILTEEIKYTFNGWNLKKGDALSFYYYNYQDKMWFLTAVAWIDRVNSSGPSGNKEVGVYQYSYTEGNAEWMVFLVDGKEQKYKVREDGEEYAPVPDFLKKGDKIGFFYILQGDTKHYVIQRFTSPQEQTTVK